jgi:hypothetical protein
MLLLYLSIVLGCAKPDNIATFKSPDPHIFYAVETYYGIGPTSADFTRVYIHFERDGESLKELVLDGDYLTIKKVDWVGANDTHLWVSGGPINSFRDKVSLGANGQSAFIHITLHRAL